MKKNNFRVSALFATVMLFCAMFVTGCVADSDEVIPGGSGEGNLYISIKTESMNGNTRAVIINNDPAIHENGNYENYLGQSFICIFSQTANGDGNHELIDSKPIDDLNGVSKIAQFNTKNYTANDIVVVASNLPTTAATQISEAITAGTLTLESLRAIQFGIVDALNDNVLKDAEHVTERRIPMYGEGTISQGDGEKDFVVNITVKHSLVKVTLNKLSVDFGESRTREATFTPKQVFLTNVPDKVMMSANVTAYVPDFGDGGKMYQGDAILEYVDENATAGQVALANSSTKRIGIKTVSTGNNRIGTDELTGAATKVLSSNDAEWGKSYYFYTLPNETAVVGDETYLVVSGSFDSDGPGSAAAEDVYYSVKLNGTTNTLQANKNYKVNMIIRSKGGPHAYENGSDPETVDAFVAVDDFDDVKADAILGGGTPAYTDFGKVVKIGDILFSDGTFQNGANAASYKTTSGEFPIGIVFHLLTPGEKTGGTAPYDDDTHHYTGLVMALRDCSTATVAGSIMGNDNNSVAGKGVIWGANDAHNDMHFTLNNTGNANAPADAAATMREAAILMKVLNVKGNNGLANWKNGGSTIAAADGNSAFKAVLNFDADRVDGEDAGAKVTTDVTTLGTGENELHTSGWYLPSIGELYKMTYSLGMLNTGALNTSAWGSSATTANDNGRSPAEWTPWGMYYVSQADAVRRNINTLISVCGDGTYDYFSGGAAFGVGEKGNEDFGAAKWVPYWSSSEWSAGYAFTLAFDRDGILNFHRDNDKSGTYRVRAVLAF